MKDIIDLLLPKPGFRALKEAFVFTVKAFITYWFISLPLFFVLFFYAFTFFPNLLHYTQLVWLCIAAFLISAIGPFFLLYRKQYTSPRKASGLPVGITETLMIEEKELLIMNTDTQKIKQKIQKIIASVSSSTSPFNKQFVTPLLIERPKLFYFLHNLLTWRKHLV